MCVRAREYAFVCVCLCVTDMHNWVIYKTYLYIYALDYIQIIVLYNYVCTRCLTLLGHTVWREGGPLNPPLLLSSTSNVGEDMSLCLSENVCNANVGTHTLCYTAIILLIYITQNMSKCLALCMNEHVT